MLVAFPSLETLDLMSVECIRIWGVQLPVESSYSFQNLTTLQIRWCNRLKFALSFVIAKSLVQLQKLSVKGCREMEEILAAAGEALVPEEKKLFPKLELVFLSKLPKLSRFCSAEVLIRCLNIKKLSIKDCPLWTTIEKEKDHHQVMNSDRMCLPSDNKMADDQLEISSLNYQRLPSFYISSITKLEVTGIRNSENLLSASMAAAFVHLEILKVFQCLFMKEVVVNKDLLEGRTSTENICFPVLKHISLMKLQNLQRFCTGDHIQCPLLEKLEIDQCPKFRTFISNSTDEETDMEPIQPLFHDQKVAFCNLKSLNLWGCKSINKIWGYGKYRSGGLDCDHHLSSSVILTIGELPNLNLLMDFQKLISLESKKSVSSWVCFQALTVLRVKKCVGMEYLFTPLTAKSLRLLKVMVVSECQRMREIITTDDGAEELQQGSSSSSSLGYNNNNNNIVFDQLEFLVLNCLPSLTSFHAGNCALEFPKLGNLVVGNCPKMINFCDHETVTAPKLHIFMNTSYVGWRLKTELNSNDHVQVDYQVIKKDNMDIEEFIKEGGDKYNNINTTIRHWREKFQNQVTELTTCEENFEEAVSVE